MDLNKKLEQVSRLFRIEGEYVGYETICIGNVNRTYEVKFILPEGTPKSFLIQNVNTYAFRQPVQLMENIDKVTEHIRAKKPGQVALHFHHTADRKTYVSDGANFWRMTNFIPSKTYGSVADPEIIHNAGRAFGEFQNQLADFDINQLYETIPDFHKTRARFEQLADAVAKDPVGRVAEIRAELDYLMSVREEACILTDIPYPGSSMEEAVLARLTASLHELGPAKIAVTGLMHYDQTGTPDSFINYLSQKDTASGTISSASHYAPVTGPSRHGTGDIFASILAADALLGYDFSASVKKAADFIGACVKASEELQMPEPDGVCFENFLHMLWEQDL